jgi:hypothetical protein
MVNVFKMAYKLVFGEYRIFLQSVFGLKVFGKDIFRGRKVFLSVPIWRLKSKMAAQNISDISLYSDFSTSLILFFSMIPDRRV